VSYHKTGQIDAAKLVYAGNEPQMGVPAGLASAGKCYAVFEINVAALPYLPPEYTTVRLQLQWDPELVSFAELAKILRAAGK